MAHLEAALREHFGEILVVNVAVKSNAGNLVDYTGILKEVGEDYLVIAEDGIGDRYIRMGALVSFYVRPSQDVSTLVNESTHIRAKMGGKIF